MEQRRQDVEVVSDSSLSASETRCSPNCTSAQRFPFQGILTGFIPRNSGIANFQAPGNKSPIGHPNFVGLMSLVNKKET